MTMEESEKRLKELLSKGETEEEILKKLTLAEDVGSSSGARSRSTRHGQ